MGELRVAALVAGAFGQVAAALAGVLPLSMLPVALAALVACALVSGRTAARTAPVTAGLASAAALVLLLATLPRLSLDRDSLRQHLGLLLVGIQVLHALTWRTRRDLQTALTVATGLLILGASFAPDVLVGLPLIAGWVAVVAGVVLASAVRSTEGVTAVATGGGRPAVLPATALALVLGLAAFLLVPAGDVHARPSAHNPRAALTGGTGVSRGTGAYSSPEMDLRVRGALSDRPVLEVPADSPQLWRSTVYPSYDGTRWTASGAQLGRAPGPPWVVGPRAAVTRTDEALPRGHSDGTIWAPGEPVVVDGPGDEMVWTDYAGTVRSTGWSGAYRVTSAVPPADPAVLRAAATGGPASLTALELPARLPTRVRALAAQVTHGAPSAYDAVLAVETWLRTHATYRLDSPVPGRGQDAVDRFLFVDRTGFCEQFAAAETVLLRSAGIPARLVTGLAYGVPAGPGRRLYREKDLHAWVEVFYVGIGWVPSDPTAGVPLAQGSGETRSVRQRAVSAVDGLLRRAQSAPGGRPALAVGLLLGALATAFVVRLVRRRPAPSAGGDEPPEPRSVGPALTAFLRYDERLGNRRRRSSESLAELAARLGPEPAAALAVVEDECYARIPPPDAAQAAALLDRLEQPTP